MHFSRIAGLSGVVERGFGREPAKDDLTPPECAEWRIIERQLLLQFGPSATAPAEIMQENQWFAFLAQFVLICSW